MRAQGRGGSGQARTEGVSTLGVDRVVVYKERLIARGRKRLALGFTLCQAFSSMDE
jgi:hypothetical protein